MAGLKTTYILRYAPPFTEWARRTLNKAQESANARLGHYWFSELLPKHFTREGFKEYKYEPRDAKYDRVKNRLLRGRGRPLVGLDNRKRGHKGGALERQIKLSGLIRATSKRVTVRMSGPHYTNMRGRSGTGPDKVKELTTISEREVNLITRMYRVWVAAALNADKTEQRHVA